MLPCKVCSSQSSTIVCAKLVQTSSKVRPALLEAKCVAYRCIFHFASREESVAIVWELRLANFSEYKWQIVIDAGHLQSPESHYSKVYQPQDKVFRCS